MEPRNHECRVSGRIVHALDVGHSPPTVIFESGLNDSSKAWHGIQPEIAKVARTLSYDRAGRGQSQYAGNRRTLTHCLDDLLAMLQAVAAHPPYVVVGHSFGGLIARMLAYRHPDWVRGLILIDTPHESYVPRVRKLYQNVALPPQRFDEPRWLSEFRQKRAQYLDPLCPHNLLNEEGIDLATCYQQVRQPSLRNNTPLTVLSSGKRDTLRQRGASGTVAEFEGEWEKLWAACQTEMLQLSSQSKQVVAHGSGHYVQHDTPEIVIDVIKEIVARSEPIGTRATTRE